MTICFVATEQMKRDLQAWAVEDDRSVSSLLRTLIDGPLDAWRRGRARTAAQRAAVGAPRTGVATTARVFEE